MIKKISLTQEQLDELLPFFGAVIAANDRGETAAIGAQIYEDGMIVKLFENERGEALATALGSNWGVGWASAEDRMKYVPTEGEQP